MRLNHFVTAIHAGCALVLTTGVASAQDLFELEVFEYDGVAPTAVLEHHSQSASAPAPSKLQLSPKPGTDREVVQRRAV